MLSTPRRARGECPPATWGAPMGRRLYTVVTLLPGSGHVILRFVQCFRNQRSQMPIAFPRSRADHPVLSGARSCCRRRPEKTSKSIPSSMLLMELLLSSTNSKDFNHSKNAVCRTRPYFQEEGGVEGNLLQSKVIGIVGVTFFFFSPKNFRIRFLNLILSTKLIP